MDYYSENLNTRRLQKCYEIAPPRIKQLLKAEIDFVLEKISQNDSVLDLGCGYGRVARELSVKAAKVVGIDISEANIEFAKNLCRRMAHLEFHKMNAVDLHFPPAIFDVTICVQNGISAFNEAPSSLLSEALRVTKKGGRILFSSYSDKIWQERLQWFQIQADEKLLGEIDYEQTKNNIIVCKDGFKAVTYSGADFLKIASEWNVDAHIYEVDNSLIFCEIERRWS